MLRLILAATIAVVSTPGLADGPETAVTRSVATVYADGRHNMNTAIARWRDRYWIAFRTGSKHSSPDGASLVLASADGEKWEKEHTVDSPLDERDVEFVATPERLFLYIPVVEKTPEKGIVCNTYVTTTDDGKTWSEQKLVYQPKFALWRPILHEGKFWATAYRPGSAGTRVLDLIRSDDGLQWEKISTIRQGHAESETTLAFVGAGGSSPSIATRARFRAAFSSRRPRPAPPGATRPRSPACSTGRAPTRSTASTTC